MDDLLLLEQSLSEESKLFRHSLRKWIDEHVIAQMATAFEQAKFPVSLIKHMAEFGLLGMNLPEQYGGIQASYLDYGLACQELERGDSALRSFVSVQNSLCIYPIFAFGDETQKQYFLPKMARGEWIGCFGLTEANSGSNPASMQTTARKTSKGWVLNGSKLWISNATLADLAIVWAKTEDGIRGFIVEKNTPGFSTQAITHKMSLRISDTGELHFNDCLVPNTHLLFGSTIGLKAALSCLNKARYSIAWGAIGAGIACFDEALAYTQTRQQFDRPIASFQLVQKVLADLFTDLTKAQLMNYQLAILADTNQLTPAMISMAKMNAAYTALQVARECRNLLGANGISLDYHVIRHMLNLESIFTYEGTDAVHHLLLGEYLTGLNAFK